MKPHPLTVLGVLSAVACHSAPQPQGRPVDDVSETYVKLVLAVGIHEPSYVDAYYGPAEWRAEVERTRPSVPQIRTDAERLLGRVRALPPAADEVGALRQRYLVKQLNALLARLEMIEGKRLRFDDESRALYDAVAPVVPESRFERVLERIDRLVPGTGPLTVRIEKLRKTVVIPRERLDAVLTRAVAECRERTRRHIALPEGESFTIEYVTDKPWGGYNWYQGNYRSIIQINTDLPIFIDRAIDLACHEGYPGHHVQLVLMEKNLVHGRAWTEFTVTPLYGPLSFVAEGSANHGIELAFPGDERVEFERRVLYPLAGLDPALAANYGEVAELLVELGHATNQAARRYLDGEIGADAAAAYLVRYTLLEPERARKMVTFIERNRSYVINYNLGRDLVRTWISRQPDLDRRWAAFERLVSSPMTASDLVDESRGRGPPSARLP